MSGGAASDAPFSLFETMRFEPGTGLVNRARHKARMAQSAQALGFPFDPAAFDEAVAALPVNAGLLRVRLDLHADGRFGLAHAPFAPLPEGTVWRLALAKTRLASADPLLPHKTSRRDAYLAARAEYTPAEADEVLLLNERGDVCEGTITSLFVEGPVGILLTPPLTSGLLAGVLRARLIAEGRAREAVIRPEQLHTRPLHVGNSLRGLIAARLA